MRAPAPKTTTVYPARQSPRQRRRPSRSSLCRRCGQRFAAVPQPVRRAAAGPHQCHPEPLHVVDLPREPVHPGHHARQHQVRAAQQQHLDQPERRADRHQQFLHVEWMGRIDSPVAPLGWSADFDLDERQVQRPGVATTPISRAWRRATHYDPQLQFRADVGYEDNQYPLSSYAVRSTASGFEWQPTERTNVVANWEHRFFGSSYLFTFDHRTPLSAWHRAARRATSRATRSSWRRCRPGNVR